MWAAGAPGQELLPSHSCCAGWLTLKTNPDCVLQSTRGTVCNACKSTPDLNHLRALLQSRLPPPPHTPKRQQPNSLTRAPTSFSPGLSPTREQHWPSLARRLPSPGFHPSLSSGGGAASCVATRPPRSPYFDDTEIIRFASVPDMNPFLNRRGMVFRCRQRPVPVVFLRRALLEPR